MKSQRNEPKRRSIFRKLLTGYIALTLVIVLLTSLVSFFLVRQYTISSNLQELRSKAETLAEMIGQPGGKTRYLSTRRWQELQALSDAQLDFINNDMSVDRQPPKIWPGSQDDLAGMQQVDVKDTLDEELLHSLLDGHSVTDVRRLDFMGDEVVFAGEPVVDTQGAQIGAVLLYRPLRQVSATTQRIALMMLIAAAFAVLIAILLALYMSQLISRPLIRMNSTAKHIAEGNYGEQVLIDQNDEVSELGATLNHLSGRLGTVIRTLSDEKSKLEQILVSIGEGLLAIDQGGQVVHHNQSALELLGLGEWQMHAGNGPIPNQQLLTDMLLAAMRDAQRQQAHFNGARGIAIEAIATPTVAEDGEVIGAVCLLRDVSEAQRLEQLRRDYIANISHELRTPLTGIRGMVEPLMDGYIETDEERMDCYRVIYQETMRLEKLITEMLDLSRLQSGRIQMELEPMEILPLLGAAQRRLQERAQQGQVEVLVEADPQLLVMGNENRILQVLIILLDNALSFTPPLGSITLGARRAGDMVAVSVADTGAGIREDDLPYIWERFYKADRSRLRTQGIGLGLSIAKLVVELMDGTIGVETELGAGTTFTFTLKPATREGECL